MIRARLARAHPLSSTVVERITLPDSQIQNTKCFRCSEILLPLSLIPSVMSWESQLEAVPDSVSHNGTPRLLPTRAAGPLPAELSSSARLCLMTLWLFLVTLNCCCLSIDVVAVTVFTCASNWAWCGGHPMNKSQLLPPGRSEFT